MLKFKKSFFTYAILTPVFCFGTFFQTTNAETLQFDIVGVVGTQSKKSNGVVLVKNLSTNKLYAVKVGHALSPNSKYRVIDATSKHVTLEKNKTIFRVRIGSRQLVQLGKPSRDRSSENMASSLNKEGNTIQVARDFKDHMINHNLDKILMQAAAIPHIQNGRLAGFEIWEIEKGSLFEGLGLENGDVVTSLDGSKITSASVAIKKLNSLKKSSGFKFSVKRKNKEMEMLVQVQN